MQIIAKCPRCRNTCRLNGLAADRRVECPECGRLFKVPPLGEMPKATRILKQAKGKIMVDQDGKTYG